MSIYFILFACSISCPNSNIILTNAVGTLTGNNLNTNICQSNLVITGDYDIAEKALADGADVFRIDHHLKVFRLNREAVYHVEEKEQGVPTKPR